MSHTPGPWFASGDLIVGGCYTPSNPKAKTGHYEIAKVISQEKPGLYPWMPDYATYEANSRLIEAAPDLLAACVAIASDPRIVRLHSEHQKKLLEVIAKATGSEATHGD